MYVYWEKSTANFQKSSIFFLMIDHNVYIKTTPWKKVRTIKLKLVL